MEKISIIVSCYNEEAALPLFYEEIEKVRKNDFKEVELEYFLVNDGCPGQARARGGGAGGGPREAGKFPPPPPE